MASGFFFGWPTLPATAGISLNSGAISVMSLTFAAVTLEARGMPLASVITWCLLPGLDAVHRAGAGLLATVGRPHEAAVDQRPRPGDLVGAAQPVEQDLVDLVPGAVGLPIPQPSPAGHPAAAVHLVRQVLPGEAGLEDEEDAGQRGAVGDGGLAALGAGCPLGQQRFDDLPQFVRQAGGLAME